MGPTLKELYQHHEKGFLGGEFFLYWRGLYSSNRTSAGCLGLCVSRRCGSRRW
jgi:hypothetical protein